MTSFSKKSTGFVIPMLVSCDSIGRGNVFKHQWNHIVITTIDILSIRNCLDCYLLLWCHVSDRLSRPRGNTSIREEMRAGSDIAYTLLLQYIGKNSMW